MELHVSKVTMVYYSEKLLSYFYLFKILKLIYYFIIYLFKILKYLKISSYA